MVYSSSQTQNRFHEFGFLTVEVWAGAITMAGLEYEIAILTPAHPGFSGIRQLVFDTWTRDFRLSPQGRNMPRDAYYPWQRARIESILGAGARIYVARDRDRPNIAFSWLCADSELGDFRAHYAYTKLFARGYGMATALLDQALVELGADGETVYTHDPAKKNNGKLNLEPRDKLEKMGLVYRPLVELKGVTAA